MTFDLSQGLVLEDQHLLIPWGITQDQAWNTGHPKPFNLPADRTRILWENTVVLQGLEASILVWFEQPLSTLDKFSIINPDRVGRSEHEWSKRLTDHLTDLMGPPQRRRQWIFQNHSLQIWIDPRFGAHRLAIKQCGSAL